ncbi:MAG: FecR domain-containing protein [Chitinophagaceae bacterium]
MSQERINYLLPLYMNDSCSFMEKEEFLQLVSLSGNDTYLMDLLEKAWQDYISEVQVEGEVSGKIFNDIILQGKHSVRPYFNIPVWAKYAAVVLLIAGTTGFIYLNQYSKKPVVSKAIHSNPDTVKHDISAPDVVHATITTASGKKIILDNTQNGTQIDNFQKVSDDNVTYYPENNDKVEYHTLTVPRGSKVITLTLSDTSKVWLNTGSSITYPTAFKGNKRTVKITGEAYFEISHNSKMPFIVEKDDAEIRVLGTHFNINAYDDERNIKVTLIMGSVRVSRAGHTTTLMRGQQVELTANGAIKLNKEVNLEEVLAWKIGRFVFNDMDIKAIMRQIMKWYDVDVIYEGKTQDRFFTADISRNTNLSVLLKVLELSNINFQLDGKKLIVKL